MGQGVNGAGQGVVGQEGGQPHNLHRQYWWRREVAPRRGHHDLNNSLYIYLPSLLWPGF